MIGDDYILIRSAQLSAKDEQKMNDILEKYDESLYEIKTFKKGKVTKTRGKVPYVSIGNVTVQEVVQNAEKIHLTGVAWACWGTEQAHKKKQNEGQELYKRLRPILEKYRPQ